MYNGYTNYETWNVALWLDGDYEIYKCRQNYSNLGKWDAEISKDFFTSYFGDCTPDLKPEDMEHVNWEEIAKNLNDE